ncbi:2-oxoglutarate dehydrogenase complex dihydrolipoyllysine-residue succinyltransferase [Simkania negevensis]|uniref:Dihydrolipoyllysine-residue succinyltransferase n=1 Tax=Simkania negevensis TaxID=83561 RepID=A0ABS3AQ93_9BACT|nr:2-oxoglutarate dehydrogenase complex dihydrolipoyllysine-residue succinyltransferase [Simkania negevensis]
MGKEVEIRIPRMGESVSEATVSQVMKPSGSFVKEDEEIIELETDKVNQVLFAPAAGRLTLTVAVDDTIAVDTVIGAVDTSVAPPAEEKEAAPGQQKAKKAEAAKPAPPPPPKKEDPPSPPTPSTGGARVTPEAFLEELGKKQEEKALPVQRAALPAASGQKETRTRMTKLRRIVAERLLHAQHTTAMLTTFNECDLSQVIALRSRYKEIFEKKHGVRLGFMSFFIKACVEALQAVPAVNSYIDGEEVVERHYYDVGIAVGTPKGLMVPVVCGCDALSFAGLEGAIASFAKNAREGTISVDDLRGGCFTITNGGIYGSMLSTPILNPPQSGILGMHNIQKRAVVVNDEIVIRPMMYLALSYDHRVVDGQGAIAFLIKVKECIENPVRFILQV